MLNPYSFPSYKGHLRQKSFATIIIYYLFTYKPTTILVIFLFYPMVINSGKKYVDTKIKPTTFSLLRIILTIELPIFLFIFFFILN